MAPESIKNKITKPAAIRIGAVAVALLMAVGGLTIFLLTGKETEPGLVYDPDVELPADYIMIVDNLCLLMFLKNKL